MLLTRVTHSPDKAIDLETRAGPAGMELNSVAAEGVGVTLHPMS